MVKQRIIINKKTGIITTVYSDQIENFLNKISEDIDVKRVSNIEFNNETKNWEAKDVLTKEVLFVSKIKSKVYKDEANWANENLRELKKIHFEKNIIN